SLTLASIGALFACPLFAIPLTSGALGWASFGLDTASWAVAAVAPALLGWLCYNGAFAGWILSGIAGPLVPAHPLRQLLLQELKGVTDRIFACISLITAVPASILGLVGLGLSIGSGVTLSVADKGQASSILKLFADVLYNGGVIVPGVIVLGGALFGGGA